VKDLIRGDFNAVGNGGAMIIVPSLETVDGDEDKDSPADVTPIIKAKIVKSRKLPHHDMSNILPTGKRIRKCQANTDEHDVGIAGSKAQHKTQHKKEKKDTRDKELDKAARQNEVMVKFIFKTFSFDFFVAEAKSCRASGWARKGATSKDG